MIISVHGVGAKQGDEWIRHHLDHWSYYERRGEWSPPPPPTEWPEIVAEQRDRAEAAARDEAEKAERETYERLKKKYG